jgi:dTDP-4-amino-4,6-dideoxygalactose transaminase
VSEPAILGGTPAFAREIRADAPDLPEWAALEAGLRGIFRRHYYTNNGPLVREFDTLIPQRIGAPSVVALANETLALMALCSALALNGSVVVPALLPAWILDALSWAGLEAIPVDVDPLTHRPRPHDLARAIGPATSAIVVSHLWGDVGEIDAYERVAQDSGIALLFDASHALGAIGGGAGVAGSASLFSFAPATLGGCVDGAFIATRDEALADALRFARSFAGASAAVDLRINAKMTEAQAMVALDAFERLDGRLARGRERFAAYEAELQSIAGLRLSGSQRYAVVEVDAGRAGLQRDELVAALAAEGIVAATPEALGVMPASAAPAANALAARILLLPATDAVSAADAAIVAGALHRCLASGPRIRRALA